MLRSGAGNWRRDGGAPFHMVASFVLYDADGKPKSKGTLDELWASHSRFRVVPKVPDVDKSMVDGKEIYKEVATRPARTIAMGNNGTQFWRTGNWVFIPVAELYHRITYAPLSRVTGRLSDVASPKGAESLDCIGTEPDLPGVPADARVALTTYCLNKGNHLLRSIFRPNNMTR